MDSVAVAAAALALTVLLQWRGGAFRSEFSAHPDESAHYVTALMLRQFVAEGAPRAPMAFAQDYYVHYPKVAIGHWPPVFYALQAAWMLPFSPSRASVLLLMAALTAGLALTLYRALRDEVGRLAAGAAALLLPALPPVQRSSGMVMAEIPLALFCLWAALALGRFVDRGRARDAVVFGVAASAAIMTKGNGLALALVTPLALALARRWRRLLSPALWAAAALVAALCGPWYVLTARMVHDTFQGGASPSAEYMAAAARLYAPALLAAGGLGLLPFLIAGLLDRAGRPLAKGGVPGKWAAAAALLLATFLFHCLMPSSREPRHMVMGIPAMLMFVAAGTDLAARRIADRRGHPERWRTSAAAAAVVAFAATGFAVPDKGWSGYGPVAERLTSAGGAAPVVLVVSDARGEGMLITEIARREPRPRRVVLRSSKMLYRSGWNGENYRPLHASSADLLSFLDQGVPLVVLDRSSEERAWEHHRLMEGAIAAHPERWRVLGTWPVERSGRTYEGAIALYRYLPAPAGGLQIPFKDLTGF